MQNKLNVSEPVQLRQRSTTHSKNQFFACSMTSEALLALIAYEKSAKVRSLLEKEPGLLLRKGTIIDLAGNTIKEVTPLGYAIGAADDVIIGIIDNCLANIKDGKKEWLAQYADYQDVINKINPQEQKPDFDFAPLLQALKEASDLDMEEELKTDEFFNVNYKSSLRDALNDFRNHFSPRIIKNGELHFNYANLQKAFDLYDENFDILYRASNNDFIKNNFFWCQIIGFIERRLPVRDRQALAQGLAFIIEDNEKLNENFDFRVGGGSFPNTSSDLSRCDLGYQYAVNSVGAGVSIGQRNYISATFKIYVEKKFEALKTYADMSEKERITCNLSNK